MTSLPQFDFYEKVRIRTPDPAKSEIDGKLAAILGRSKGDDGRWGYAVHVYGVSVCYYCTESELEATGEFDKRDSFYTGKSARVSIDGRVLGK